jgi:hypothetical protein
MLNLTYKTESSTSAKGFIGNSLVILPLTSFLLLCLLSSWQTVWGEIHVTKNPNYNLDVQTERYSPIKAVDDKLDRGDCKKLFKWRKTVMKELTSIILRSDPKVSDVAKEFTSNNYPIIVASHKRSAWIQKRLLVKANDFNISSYKDSNFRPVWYDPERNLQKHIIIVVNQGEYGIYKDNLKDIKNILVVGCSASPKTLVGFGFNRLCSMAVGYKLYTKQNKRRANKFSHILFVDDNVTYVNDFSANQKGFLENILKNKAVFGWGGAKQNKGFLPHYTKGKNYPTDKKKNTQTGNLTTDEKYIRHPNLLDYLSNKKQDNLTFKDAGLLEQFIFWSFSNLKNNGLMSPYFLTSNEDVSFSKFITKTYGNDKLKNMTIGKIPLFIVKYQVGRLDDTSELDKQLTSILDKLYAVTNNIKVNWYQKEASHKDGTLTTFRDIVKRANDFCDNRETVAQTGSKIVEKILAKCVELGLVRSYDLKRMFPVPPQITIEDRLP